MNIEILQERSFLEPRLTKPEQLKGLSPIGTIKFSRASCQVFELGNTTYIKHRDWFSRSISIPEAVKAGLIDKIKKKFIYNDNFGSIVLRNEAWLAIQGDLTGFKPSVACELVRETERLVGLPEFDLEYYDWIYFYEQLVDLKVQ